MRRVGCWGALVLVGLVAGCSGPPKQGEPYHHTEYGSIPSGDYEWIEFSIHGRATFSYDMTIRNGTASVYVMDASEGPNFEQGGAFNHFTAASHEHVSQASDALILDVGQYAIGMRCDQGVQPCDFTLAISITPPQE